ncbi:DUF2167 domain-containing protein [Plastoroseomonas hellenica]|uniref:DUF2167 domain-containing protein n=1 Tax=Plastoroseomonas hellenica TaxID=2687306 RepID=UPI001BADC4D7|nr:DUF2167 domain-containing protein [Plastoroseomonas hellenica]MBR0646578.1 DUF2167 domain-containing protein [Plastoroseomonas hellenica]
MRALLKGLLIIGAMLLAQAATAQQESVGRQLAALPWQTAPGEGTIGSVARISLEGGLRFLDESASSRFLELNGNPPRRGNWVLTPAAVTWFAVFSFEQIGYVRDDEHLDANELLRALQQGDSRANAERQRLGMPTLRTDGWAVEPRYDPETRRLEWATRLVDDRGDATINYSIRLLGRGGVMTAILVSDPQHLTEDMREFRAALRGFDYQQGERYAEYRQGDRIAEYGLAGLILGGAAVAGAGFLKSFGKVIGLGVLAAGAAVFAFFKRFFVKDGSNPPGR